MAAPRFVKICGITTVEDAALAVSAGASAIGLNVVPSSRRRVDEATAIRIARAVERDVLVVLVVADLTVSEMVALRTRTGVDWLQLHGGESAAALEPLLPSAFKAHGIATEADVLAARAYGGEWLLADSKAAGGSGVRFDWSLVGALARERPLILAGGLTPENVGEAVRQVRPFGVDVASGVEIAPGKKDPEKVRAFVRAARTDTK